VVRWQSVTSFAGRGTEGVSAPSDRDRRGQGRGGHDRTTAQGLLEKTIDRLEDLVDEETSALRAHKATDLRDFNNRKSQALLELSRVARMVGSGPLDLDLRDRLGVLHAKLETNRGVIKMHLDAVREIAAVVSGSIQDSQSDGTYSPTVRKAPESK